MENGFYIWNAKKQVELMHALNLNQVVEVIEDEVWLTGMAETFEIKEALKFGAFGECVFKANYY